jgi:transcriptional regulator with XRE-family HTH domain
MARRKKTQADLADLLGIVRQGVSQRLAGQVDFRIGELQTIADYFGVPLAELVDDDRASA